MSLVAGGSNGECKDGVGEAARFDFIFGLLTTRDGQTLYATENSIGRVRSISFETAGSKTGTVKTVAGDGQCANRDGTGVGASLSYPRELVWVSDDETTEMLIACMHQMTRFNTKTGKRKRDES